MLSAVIWDLDYASADAFDQHVSDYAPNWWGSQWVDPNFEKYFMYRAVVLSDIPSNIDLPQDPNVPETYQLHQNYPNPFNPTTMINYQLPMTDYIELSIYNVLGQKVATLVSERQAAGAYQVEWDASGYSSGVYYYSLKAGEFYNVKKMILIR